MAWWWVWADSGCQCEKAKCPFALGPRKRREDSHGAWGHVCCIRHAICVLDAHAGDGHP